jgi:3-deoxy-7-phosphoheptulonate synthase
MAIVTEALDPEGAWSWWRSTRTSSRSARATCRTTRCSAACGRARQAGAAQAGHESATIDELLLAAEYLLAEGNEDVILCERGVRSFDNHTRNLLDLTAIPVVKALSHLPIIADPSHGTGMRSKVTPMARAAVAAGADGAHRRGAPGPGPRCPTGPSRSIRSSSTSSWPDRVIARAIDRDLVPSLAERAAAR